MAQTFDEKELVARVDGDMGFLADTVQVLEADGRSLLGEIKTGLSAGDASAVGRSGHTLKGMISNFCAPAAQALALEVENAGKAGDLAAAGDAAARLESELEALIGELSSFAKASA